MFGPIVAEERVQTTKSSPTYRGDIDGLRAIAVTSVVLFHAGLWPLRSGFVGVDIFFVISGFLLGGIIYRESRENRFSFANFYARRARRILPALFLVLLATLAAGALLLAPAEYSRVGSTGTYVALAISNVRFWKVISYFTPEAALDPLLMTWSLGVEEQFYLLFPLFLVACLRLSPRLLLPALIVLSTISFTICVILTESERGAAFYLLHSRAWELGAGAALAVLRARASTLWRPATAEVVSVAGLLGLIFSVVSFDESAAFPGWRAALPVLATIAVISAEGSRLNRSIFGAAPMAWVGRLSYSWYLWHWPILAYLRISTVGVPSPEVVAGAVALSLVAAFVSHRFVETPFRRPTLPAGTALIRYGLAVAAIATLAAGIRFSAGFPSRTQPIVDNLFTETKGGDCVVYQGVAFPNMNEPCVVATGGISPVVGLIGDSHAGALSPGLLQLAAERGWRVDVMAKASCPPLLGAQAGEADVRGCAAFNRKALEVVSNDPAVRAVFLTAYWAAARKGHTAAKGEFERGLARSVEILAKAGKRTYLIDDSPNWQTDPARWIASENIPARRSVSRFSGVAPEPTEDVSEVRANRAALDRVAATTGATVLSLRTGLCKPACRFRDADAMFYTDKHHLSARGSQVALLPVIAVLRK